LNDLEDDPEFRSNVNLYKNDDAIAELEAEMGALTLNEGEKSKFGQDLKQGKTKVMGEMREIKEIKRKTDKGKKGQKAADDERIKGDKLF
jgi:hypothetical protein